MQQWLKKALAEVREGLAATKRMLLERCEMRRMTMVSSARSGSRCRAAR
jgi:hypothetical protein